MGRQFWWMGYKQGRVIRSEILMGQNIRAESISAKFQAGNFINLKKLILI